MHIVIISDYGNLEGGISQVAISSALGLAGAGVNVSFIFAQGPSDPRLSHKNIELHDLQEVDLLSNPNRLAAMATGIWNLSAAKKIDSILKEMCPSETVVHIHSWTKALSASACKASINNNLKTTITIHDYFAVCPNGGFYNYQINKPCTVTPLSAKCILTNCDSRNYAHKLWRVARQIISKSAGIPDGISDLIYVTNYSLRIISPYISNKPTFWHIRNPISFERETPARPDQNSFFTFVGRLSIEKGADLLAEATKNTSIKINFVGSGPLADKLQIINANSKLSGWADREQLKAHMKKSRAIVVPSKLYETQGMVVAEAAALGVPCIVSDDFAGSEFVEDGRSGLIFKSGDTKSLLRAILKLNDNPVLAKELGFAAYNKYWNNPSTIDNHVDSLMECYAGMLKGDQGEDRRSS